MFKKNYKYFFCKFYSNIIIIVYNLILKKNKKKKEMVVAILIYNNSILKIYIKSQTQIISQDCSNERYHSNVQHR